MAMITLTLGEESKDFDLTSLTIGEARDMKRLIGIWTRREWIDLLIAEDPDALAFAWWLANKRAGTPLTGSFLDINFEAEGLRVTAEIDPDAAEPTVQEDVDPELPTNSATQGEVPT